MKVKLLTAEDYRASLPLRRNKRGIIWTIETFSTYVHLRYSHVTVAPDQVWNGVSDNYKFVCSIHGPFETQAHHVLNENEGCRCRGCKSDKTTASAGKVRSPRATKEEKEYAAKLRSEGLSYLKIGRQLGRSDKTICRWFDPKQAEKSRQDSAKWKSENIERSRATSRRYSKEFEHGRANSRAKRANRRLLELNTPEFVFFDNEWHEVDRRETYKVFKDYLLPPAEKKGIQELYMEAQHQTETTGIEHHVDHLWPLSVGGEHRIFNLQILPANENLSKKDTFREEDQALIIQRLFN